MNKMNIKNILFTITVAGFAINTSPTYQEMNKKKPRSSKMHCENGHCTLEQSYYEYYEDLDAKFDLTDEAGSFFKNYEGSTSYFEENELFIIRDKNGNLKVSSAKNFTNLHEMNNPLIHRCFNPDDRHHLFFIIEEQSEDTFFEKLKKRISNIFYNDYQNDYQIVYQQGKLTATAGKAYNAIAVEYYARQQTN